MVVEGATAALPLAGLSSTWEAEPTNGCRAKSKKAEVDLGKMNAKLENPQFLAKAKDEAIEEARRTRKAELLETIRRLAARRKAKSKRRA